MKKLTMYFTMISMVLVLVTGCKGKDKTVENDPKAVVSAFFERMSKKDLDGAAKLATRESKGTIDMMKKAIDAAEKMGVKDSASKGDPSEEFKKMEIGEVKIDGDNATVSVTNHAKGDEIKEFPLKKEDGQWKVDFSMGTLMKMGMDEASKMHDNNTMNTDTAGMQDMMNTDTMNKNMDTTSHQ
ncbi:MAG: hypothetical protein ABI688_01480 [Bacteroidota bacterium]